MVDLWQALVCFMVAAIFGAAGCMVGGAILLGLAGKGKGILSGMKSKNTELNQGR